MRSPLEEKVFLLDSPAIKGTRTCHWESDVFLLSSPGRQLRDSWQNGPRRLSSAARHHGSLEFQPPRPGQHLPNPVFHPSLGECLLWKVWGKRQHWKSERWFLFPREDAWAWFVSLQTDCQEVASVLSAKEIRVVAELLQISPEGLQKSITYKVTVRELNSRHAHQ